MGTFFGFKKAPFSDSPDGKQLFASQAWNRVKARLQFLVDHHAVGLLTGEVGAGKSTAAAPSSPLSIPACTRSSTCTGVPDPAWICCGNWHGNWTWDQADRRGDLVRQISEALVRLNQNKKQHSLLICDEAHLLCHPALEQFPLLLTSTWIPRTT